jgi:hypothetical protein
MGTRSDKQNTLIKTITELEAQLRDTLNNLVAAKLELRLFQELENDSPVPRRRAAATTITKREKIARILRDTHPEGLPLEKIREALIRNYSEHIEKSTLSPMLNRLKRDGYIFRGKSGTWFWANDPKLAIASVR